LFLIHAVHGTSVANEIVVFLVYASSTHAVQNDIVAPAHAKLYHQQDETLFYKLKVERVGDPEMG
jgi:hypothetical protein